MLNITFASQPISLLQKLIQFDTTNPPGHELECIQFIQNLLLEAGIESQIFAKSTTRPNLLARLRGEGRSAPLLLYGHVDVVTTEHQTWTQPPFEGKLIDGFVWGRGALDMKGGVAMIISAFLQAKRNQIKLPGDVILAIVCDEEAGGDFGAKFLVEHHPEQFAEIRYAIGEFGGFSFSLSKQRFYPIQVAEKQICWLKATIHGRGGHGSIPIYNGAMAKLAHFLQTLNQQLLPVHITPVAQQMVTAIAENVGGLRGLILRQLLTPCLTHQTLRLLGERGRAFAPLFRHTITPTILYGSQQINVIPSQISVELDGRLLPGYCPQDMLQELSQLNLQEVEFEITRYDAGPSAPDMKLFDTLAEILREADPMGIPIPMLLSGVTDSRFFSKLGIQTYGFLPMQLPDNFNFTQVIHAADERIPATALDFGTQAIYQILQRF